ncbi:MAG: bacterio-opsin activator [Aquificaceae bacterium]
MAIEVGMEPLVLRTFLKAIHMLYGFSNYKIFAWLPSIARAVYCVVLREEYLRTEEEIAQRVGLTLQTVRNILRADPNMVLEKLNNLEAFVEEERELKVHTAGGIAKLAYKLVKEGHEEPKVFLLYCERTAYALDIPWAYMTLRRLKDVNFPIKSPEDILDKLDNIYIKGRTAKEVLKEIDYPIKNPAELLYKIRENLKMYGLE